MAPQARNQSFNMDWRRHGPQLNIFIMAPPQPPEPHRKQSQALLLGDHSLESETGRKQGSESGWGTMEMQVGTATTEQSRGCANLESGRLWLMDSGQQGQA